MLSDILSDLEVIPCQSMTQMQIIDYPTLFMVFNVNFHLELCKTITPYSRFHMLPTMMK